jgi:hypothetical protein
MVLKAACFLQRRFFAIYLKLVVEVLRLSGIKLNYLLFTQTLDDRSSDQLTNRRLSGEFPG